MKVNHVPHQLWIAIVASSSLLPTTSMAAGEGATESFGTTWFGGVRAWVNSWDVPLGDSMLVIPSPTAPSPALKIVPTSRQSNTEISAIPYVGIKSGNVSVSLAHQFETKYSVSDASNGIKRKETDITFGYAILPGLTASVGVKEARISQTDTDHLAQSEGQKPAKVQVLLFGISGSAPLNNDWGLYGNVAYGPSRTKIDYGPLGNKFNGDYKIGEFGLSYRIPMGTVSTVKSLTATLGYRSQVVKARNLPFPAYDLSTGTPVLQSLNPSSQTSTTQGLVFGLVGAF